jgi:N-methylhydantoinase B
MHLLSSDPVTFEMVRHKLHMVIAEAMDALRNVSGSPSTSEALDMMVSLYNREGNLMLGGVGFTHHITSAVQAVKHLLSNYGEDPGIGEDDAYFLNDPYVAALHAPDVYIISPIHHDHELLGFVANFVHVTDVGGVDPGGFCPNARESFQEGFQTRGLKLVEGGALRRDVLDTFLNMVRDPKMTQLDLRSQLAANHVAKERMARLISDFGVDTVLWVAGELVDQSEKRLRERLRELPDGTWRARQYVDASDYLVKVELAATKEDDCLTYDFTGSSEQLPIAINCTYWASWGALLAPVFPQLAWDLTWNEGITRPVRMIAPEGTIVNCLKPAPTSISTVGIVQVINNLSTIVASKMLGASRRYRDRATAVWHGSHASVRIHGYRTNGEYFISPLTDTFCGSGGATASHDGVDMGGELPNVVSRWGNVERHELMAPLVYLYRRRVIDSGGAGKYRGGLSHEFGFTANAGEVSSRGLNVTLFGKGVRSPMSLGLFGGYPGCPIGYATFRGLGDIEMLERPPAHDARAQEHSSWGTHVLKSQDLQVIRYNGGGGYGDPLERNLEAVLRDVREGAISAGAARDIYGVVINEPDSVDVPSTHALRRALRAERIGREVDVVPADRRKVAFSGEPISEYLQVTSAGAVQCTWCGHEMAGNPWKDYATVRSSRISRAYANCYDDETLALREFFCPTCGTLLECEVGLSGDSPLYDKIQTGRLAGGRGPRNK